MSLFHLLRPLVLCALVAPLPALAADLPAPQGDVLLTITGAIAHTNDGEAARFDRAMLEAMEPRIFETKTIWTEGVQEFTGVALSDLMAAVGAEGSSIAATAVNDYSVDIPAEDWAEDGPIVAYLANGAPMSLRDKGPLWIVYPYDSKPEYQAEVIYSRSIWQLERITVQE